MGRVDEFRQRVRQQMIADDVKKVDQNYIDTYVKAANNFVDTAQKDYEGMDRKRSYQKMLNRKTALSDLEHRQNVIRNWMDQNKSRIGNDNYSQMTGFMDNFNTTSSGIMDQFAAVRKLHEQFRTDAEYQTAVEYGLDKLIGSQTFESKALSGLKSYEAQKVVDEESKSDNTWGSSYFLPTTDTTFAAAPMATVIDAYRNDTSYREPSDIWSENQKRQFGYLYAEDPSKAYEFAEKTNNNINAQIKYDKQQEIRNAATKDFASGAKYTAGALAAAPLGLAEYLDNIAEYVGRGTITQKDYIAPTEFSSAVTGGIGQKLNEDYGTISDDVSVLGGKGWGDLYQLGVGTAQSIIAANTVGRVAGTAGVLTQFFGQAAASGVDDALSRGASAEQAILYGTAVGAFEGLTEMLDADRLIKAGSAATVKNYILNIAKQMYGEGVEEGLSSIAGNVADRLILQDKSEYVTRVQELVDGGMAEEDAKKQAVLEIMEDAAFDALGGVVSGGVSAGVQGAVATAYDAMPGRAVNRNARSQYGDRTGELISEGLANPQNTESYKLAKKYQQQVDGKEGKKGKAMTGFQIRNLLAANQEQIEQKDLDMIRAAAEKRLRELGETDNAAKLADIATRYVTGGEISRSEKKILANSENGSLVQKELTPETVAEWAQEIGTKSVHALPYNTKKIMEEMAKAVESKSYKPLEERVSKEETAHVAESGKATVRSTGKEIDLSKPEVVQIKDGRMVMEVNGQKVSTEDIDYADGSQEYLFRAVAQIEHITPAAASAIINEIDTGKAVAEQLDGMDEAYTYGYYGYSEADLAANQYGGSLTSEQLMGAYRLGQYERRNAVDADEAPRAQLRTARQAAISKEQEAKRLMEQVESDNAEVYYENGGNAVKFDQTGRKFDETRMAGVNAAKFLSKMGIGGKYYFYESYVNEDGVRVYKNAHGEEEKAPNGIFKAEDGSIHIDLNAGNQGEGVTAWTLGHELVHFVRQNSQKQFERLAAIVTESFDKTDKSMHQRVVDKQNLLSEIRGTHVTYDEAYEEVVADAMSTMFTEGNIYEKIAEIKAQDRGLFNTIKRFFENLFAKFKEFYDSLEPDQQDAKDIRSMKDMLDKIQTAFAEALVEASENFRALEEEAVESLGENAKVETNAEGDLLLASNEQGNVQVYSERTYMNGGRDKLEMALRQNGHTEAEIKQTLSYVDDALDYIKILAAGYAKNMGYNNLSDHLIADIVTNVKTGKQVMSAIVNNGDYPVNIDLSLICKKRVAYMNLMSRLIRDGVFDKVNYDGAAIAEVNEILRNNGFETACLGCFVESRRLQFQTWAETIVSEWNAEVAKRNPNATEFGFATGKMEKLTDADINALTRELESVKKNDQGNVNLGQGNSVTRMGRLLDALPSLQKKLTVEDLLTPEGLTALRKHDGSLFSIVKSRYGAASPKIVQDFNPYASEIAMMTFASVKNITNNAVKGAQAYVKEVGNEYGKLKRTKGETAAEFNRRKKEHNQKVQDEAMRRYLYDIGGARIQSFSDFMIENVFDYIQIFADLSAKRLPLHGYTKEIVCMRLFGMTGAKWNGSLIAHVERNMGKELAGLLPAGNKDGIPVKVDGKDYVIGFDDYARNAATGGKSFIQSIGMKDIVALQLDPRYSPFVGSITIGVSDAQILAMLDHPLFRMVIPYHASGMLPQFAKLVGVDLYNDYTDYQNTTVRQYYDLNGNAVEELRNAKGEAVKADTSFAFNAEIQKTKDAKTAAKNYLNWCAQRHEVYDGSKLVGYATFNPKFSSSPYGTDFTRHENYYKLLEDFNTYDCITEASTVQGSVTMNFPSEENRLTEQQMAEYKKALRETGIFTEKDIEKYAKKANMTLKDIIAAEVGNRANYAAAQAPKWEATVKEVEAKLQKDYERDEKRSDRDSTGKQLTKEQQDYFASSVVRDADGRLMVMYHGTANGGAFTVFDGDQLNNSARTSQVGQGFYFTNAKAEAKAYTKNVDIYGRSSKGKNPYLHEVYLNITNPFNVAEDTLNLDDVKAVYGDGTYDYFFDSWIPFYLNRKSVHGEVLTEAAVQAMSKEDKVSLYVDYLAQLGTKELLSNMVRAFPYGKQSELLAAMQNRLGYDGIVEEYAPGKYQYVSFSSEQVKSVENKKPTADPDIRFSYRDDSRNTFNPDGKTLDEQLDDVLNTAESFDGRYLYVGRFTPEFINMVNQFVNIKNLPIVMNYRDAYLSMESKENGRYKGDNINYHNLGKDGMKNAIEAISNPEQVLLSNKEGKIELVLESVDYKGNKILSIVALNTSAQNAKKFIEAHIVTSIYGRRSMDKYVAKAEKEGRLIYSKKEEPVQGIPQVQYKGDINTNSSFDTNVSRNSKEVKSERTPDSVSNRSLLANAFEGITQNSSEYKMIQRYKANIAELNSLEDRLRDFNEQIHDLRFGRNTERDAEKLARLEEEAAKIADAISAQDKKLFNLESSDPLRKVIERERIKASQKTRERMQNVQKNRKLRKEQTELRYKIRKTVRELDKLLNRGNKKKNVKEDLQTVVSAALKSADVLFTENYTTVDMLRNGIQTDLSPNEEALVKKAQKMLAQIDAIPNDGYESYQERQKIEEKLKPVMAKLSEVFARERQRLNNTEVSAVLKSLAEAYKGLEKSGQSYVQGAYTEAVYNFISEMASQVGGTKVMDMSTNQLEYLLQAYKMVLTTVRKANEMFNKNLTETRDQLGKAVISEVASAGGQHLLWTKEELAANEAFWNNTKPVWVADKIGSGTFGKLMKGLFEGQYNFARDVEQTKRFKQEMDAKYRPRQWDNEALHEFVTERDNKFNLNLQQMMSIYAFSKREQSYSHLLNGGFVFDNKTTVIIDKHGFKRSYTYNGAKAYQLDIATIGQIIGTLTKEQRAFVDEMQSYLSDVMGEKGNEVSMAMYGIKLFKEKDYFPLRSSGDYLEKAKEAELKKQQGQINISNAGFTHAVVPDAKNPVILSGFMDVWADHCNEMSMYHSMVLPMEDFRKVYNYHTIHDDKSDSKSVYQTIQDAYGEAAVKYINQLYQELNAGATVDPRETPFKTFISRFKKAAVMMSASVVVQQFSSVGRAWYSIDPKYFTGAKIESTALKSSEEMKKYAPVAIIKEMGGFDTGTKGNAKSYILAETYERDELAQNLLKDEQLRGDLMGYLPAKADELTWTAIWEATKREIAARNPKMDVKGEAFLNKCGERFSQIIEQTQVYDSVLARSANMRSTGALMQMATAFMAEPTTTINLLESAVRSKNKKTIARAFGAVAASIILNNALASVVYALRDDDEDETFIEKYFQQFASGMVEDINPMSYYPFLKDINSIFQGYDVERADMSVITDVRDAAKKVYSVMDKDTSKMDADELLAHKQNVTAAMMKMIDAVSSLLGIPFKNVRRDAKMIVNAYNMSQKDAETSWLSFWDKVANGAKDAVPGLTLTKDESKADKLIRIILADDQKYLKRLKNSYKTEQSYHTAVRSATRDAFNDDELDALTARQVLRKHGGLSADEAEDKVNEWIFQKNYPQYDLTSARIEDWYDIAKPMGIPVSTYTQYVNRTKDLESIKDKATGDTIKTKKEQVVAVINSLPLSKKQKDALFLMDYAESGLDETPWHN